MRLYVYGLVECPLQPWTTGGRTLRTLKLTRGVYAVGERRRDPPLPTDVELRRQHALVVDLARRVDALLPARFGSLVDTGELKALARSREPDIRAALAAVRGNVQLTLRFVGRRPAAPRAGTGTGSGREYLMRRRDAVTPQIPRRGVHLLARLAPLVSAERREPGAGRLLATVYHLVSREDITRYRRIVAGAALPGAILTGPWPPFAFAPRLSP